MVVIDLTEHPAPVIYDRGFFFANEFGKLVDLPIDIHTAMEYNTYIESNTQEWKQ